MSIPVVMPQLGLTMEEGTVTGWLKNTGDSVKKDEPLFTLTTEKAEMEVESPADGTLGEILIQAGEVVPVGTVLAYLERVENVRAALGSEQPSSHTLQQSTPRTLAQRTESPEPSVRNEGAQIPDSPKRNRSVSPRAKRLAKELGVNVEDISNSGPIREADIQKAARPTATSKTIPDRRQLIAERLTRSVLTIPTFTLFTEADAEKLVASYEFLKESILKAAGARVTITDLLLKVLALALRETPELNSVWLENSVHNMTSVDIGLAIDTPKGVIAPVLRNADSLNVQTLAIQRAELTEKTRRGQLSLTELEGGVATLSNLGMYRVDHFQAIISPGQSSILAVGQIRKRPWVDITLGIKLTIMLNLTVDHRVADGAAAATFLGQIVGMIESSEPALWTTRPRGDGDGAGKLHV